MDDTEISIVLMVAALLEFLWMVCTKKFYILSLLCYLFMFPSITGCIGYRRTYQLGGLMFSVSVVLLPLCNCITGPVPVPTGSGSGHGSLGVGSVVSITLTTVATISRATNPRSMWILLLGYQSTSGWCCVSSLRSSCCLGTMRAALCVKGIQT